eukprot:scaffold61324_cov26-Prasinocladus_malaysianus.AAC.1
MAGGALLSFWAIIAALITVRSSGKVIYCTHGPEIHYDCCTNNNFAKVISRLQDMCKAAGPDDVVQLPGMLEADGRLMSPNAYRALDVLDVEAISHLKEIAKRHYNCTIVTRDEAEDYGQDRQLLTKFQMAFKGPFTCWFYTRLK